MNLGMYYDEVQAHVRNSKEVLNAIMCFEGLDSKIQLPHMNYLDIQSLMGHYGVKTFWNRNDLPAEVYLKHCIAAAKSISKEYLNNFLDTSYLNDRKVTLREYLASTKELCRYLHRRSMYFRDILSIRSKVNVFLLRSFGAIFRTFCFTVFYWLSVKAATNYGISNTW